MKAILFLLLFRLEAFGHGTEKPGPHGGHVLMPGAFHTELKLDIEGNAHIYLLDMEFKNPTVKNSSVEVYFTQKSKKIPFTCDANQHDHFLCKPQAKLLAQGEIVVKAKREHSKGNDAIYKLPLKEFQKKPQTKEESHENHH